jgi:hypothetical protein
MAKNEEMTNDYRLERKKRLAKAAKTRKKGGDSTRVVSIIIYAICIVAVLALCCFGLYQFGVPQKVMPALKVGDKTYSVAEYSYYYTNVFQTYANSQNSLGIALYDASKDPASQTTTDKDGNTITFDELFRNQVKENLENQDYYLKLAKADGVTLSEDSKKEIDSTISELETYAKQYGYSSSRYISVLYGKGLNLKKFRSILENQYLVSQYTSDKNADVYSNITDEEIETKYAEDPSAYQQVDIRLLGMSLPDSTATDTDAAAETAAIEAKANEMLDRITDEASFIELAKEYCDEGDRETFESESASLVKGLKKSIVSSNISSELADWLFDSARTVGDKRVFTADKYEYVIYIIKTAYRSEDQLVSARHILISFDSVKAELESQTESEDATATDAADLNDLTEKTVEASDGTKVTNKGTSYSSEVVLKAYEQAKDILEQFENGEKTEEAFGALAEQYSADTGSVGENATNGGGGLYTDIEKGQMVAPFEEWVYNEARQPGDTGIVMTNYGWHVMYFVSRADEPAWKADIRNTIGQGLIASSTDALQEEIGNITTEKAFYNFAVKSVLKNINKLYISSNNG